LGSIKGHGFFGESKPLKRRYEAEPVSYPNVRAERGIRKEFFDLWRGDKALKSEAQERWGLKEVPQDVGSEHR
jgi:hypothetical protein